MTTRISQLNWKLNLTVLLTAGLFPGVQSIARADVIAFVTTNTSQMGTIDLNTGTESPLAANPPTVFAGLGVSGNSLFGAEYQTANGGLWNVSQSNGSLSSVGNSGIDYFDFGSTSAGLYAVDHALNLYSVDPATGSAASIGPLGIGLSGVSSALSTSGSSSTLFFADGQSLYTVNTSDGHTTLVGNMGSSQMLALLLDGGVLYGVDFSNHADTIDQVTGSVTIGPGTGGLPGQIYGLAPDPQAAGSAPEPANLLLVLVGLSLGAVAKTFPGYATAGRAK